MTLEEKDTLIERALPDENEVTEGRGDEPMRDANTDSCSETRDDISGDEDGIGDTEYGDTGADSADNADIGEEKPGESATQGDVGEGDGRDGYYERLILEDTEAIRREFPELPEDFSITDLKDPLRFGALRDLGLSPVEAYLAVGTRRQVSDNRAHLFSTVPRGAVSRVQDIPRSELKIAREVFSDMSEGDLQRLYRKVCGK